MDPSGVALECQQGRNPPKMPAVWMHPTLLPLCTAILNSSTTIAAESRYSHTASALRFKLWKMKHKNTRMQNDDSKAFYGKKVFFFCVS